MTDEAKKAKMIVAPFTIGTHSGTFHCDEVLACYLLSQHPEFSKHQILRTRDQPLLDQCDIVVDVGAVFDAEKKRFDHHQRGFNETFGSLRPELDTKCDIKSVSLISKRNLLFHVFLYFKIELSWIDIRSLRRKNNQ